MSNFAIGILSLIVLYVSLVSLASLIKFVLKKLEYERHINQEKLNQIARDKPYSEHPVVFNCTGHPNRTLALRYGVMNAENGVEKNTIRLVKQGLVQGFEGRGHYYAELCDYENTKVRVVINEGSDYINTFYPLSDEEWFQKYETLEKLLKNNDSFTLKELAKYHIDVVVIPGLKAS
ncbi:MULTISPECIES: hypothetical protein [unclassified Oleiphilus]|uniref:hypothetical protein n=2 Tax=Oleiphilus TaxID=141450 RepID=UPI0007C26C30|nr:MULTISPECIES: hypothetical protein [unclassified Oleiphilus]KZY43420.1 hypothetical protein A3732_14335 [Oleiphilus sp. HI0050]KZZ35446.1 hypothetical protein A3756_15635 [Oleiphilus sp. HI0086]KZZ36298.1 hypothetical protein A3757_13975 [Oleiphilus sp. HI0117]